MSENLDQAGGAGAPQDAFFGPFDAAEGTAGPPPGARPDARPAAAAALQFYPYSTLAEDFLDGVEAAWPDRSWPLFGGSLKIANHELLDPHNIAPLIAWRGEQIWRLAGRILGGEFRARLVLSKTATLEVALLGIDASSRDLALMGLLAGAVTLGRSSQNLDEQASRFLARVDMARAIAGV